MTDFTDEKLEAVVLAIQEGRPVIANCTIGFMLREPISDGVLECSTEGRPIRGKAEAEHVRQVIASWGEALAAFDAVHGDDNG